MSDLRLEFCTANVEFFPDFAKSCVSLTHFWVTLGRAPPSPVRLNDFWGHFWKVQGHDRLKEDPRKTQSKPKASPNKLKNSAKIAQDSQ